MPNIYNIICGTCRLPYEGQNKRFCSTKCYEERELTKDELSHLDKIRKLPKRAIIKYTDELHIKKRARNILQRAIENNKIERKPCEKCGDIKSQGHHEDYSKPLDVIWLCPKHHTKLHYDKYALL